MIECRREGIQRRMMMRRGDANHSLILLLAILPSCISLPSPSPPGTPPRMGSPPAASPLSPIAITPTPPPPSANLSPIPPAPPPGIESITKPDPGPIHPPPPLPRADVPKAAPSAIILLLLSTVRIPPLVEKFAMQSWTRRLHQPFPEFLVHPRTRDNRLPQPLMQATGCSTVPMLIR
jgi:hypothetical protein